MDDDSLERLFRASLAERAEDMSGDDPAVRAALARAGVRRRRRLSATVGVAAAVAVIAPIAVVAATRNTSPTPVADHPSSWRAESYNGIQLWVPPSWGWGMTPVTTGEGLQQCGYGAYAGSGSTGDLRYSKADATPPYVGRPMPVGTSCPAPPREQVAHVWFDSPLPAGTAGTATTIAVQGLTPFRITVADADAAERSAILDSIERVDTDANGCLAARTGDAVSSPRGPASVCLYYVRRGSASDRTYVQDGYLFYSTTVDGQSAQVVATIKGSRPGAGEESSPLCLVAQGLSAVTMTLQSTGRLVSYTLPMSLCAGQRLTYNAPGDIHLVTKSSVRLWAVDAVPLYAGGSVPNALTPYLPH